MPLARYVRLLCHSSRPGGGGYYRIGEIEMRTAPGGANLCSGGTAFGNSNYFPASQAFDGSISNASNVWAGNPGDGRTIGYDFGSSVDVNMVTVRNSDTASMAELAQHLLSFDIQTSADGTTWSTVLSVSDHPDTASAGVDYSIQLFNLSGAVRDASGALCARVVRAYRRDTGALVASSTSDATTGAYSFVVRDGPHTILFLPASGESLNALVLDNVEGV